jgi:hypothetical protein
VVASHREGTQTSQRSAGRAKRLHVNQEHCECKDHHQHWGIHGKKSQNQMSLPGPLCSVSCRPPGRCWRWQRCTCAYEVSRPQKRALGRLSPCSQCGLPVGLTCALLPQARACFLHTRSRANARGPAGVSRQGRTGEVTHTRIVRCHSDWCVDCRRGQCT